MSKVLAVNRDDDVTLIISGDVASDAPSLVPWLAVSSHRTHVAQ